MTLWRWNQMATAPDGCGNERKMDSILAYLRDFNSTNTVARVEVRLTDTIVGGGSAASGPQAARGGVP